MADSDNIEIRYFCLYLLITHGDMKENVSGCFFLNTV